VKKLLLLSLLSFSGMAFADGQSILNASLKSYKESGSKEFISTLLKNSPIAKEKSMLVSLESTFPTFETFFGKPMSINVLREVTVSQKVKNIFFTFNYETGPIFGMMTTFDGPNGEVVTYVTVNANQGAVLPDDIIEGHTK
jgi:hypothetical protein